MDTAKEKKTESQLKGDVTGGLTSSLIPFPRAMALGALVFSPLGPEYMPYGIVAGLISLGMTNLVAAPLGCMPVMTSAPFSLSSLMLMGVVSTSVANFGDGTSSLSPEVAAFTMVLLFLTVFMSGVIQVAFGLCRIGDLAKYIPYPVLAGLLNGSATLIILTQINMLLGLPKSVSIFQIFGHLSEIQHPRLLVGVIVCLAIWLGPKISKKIPSPFYGIFVGTAVFYLFQRLSIGKLGPVIGDIPSTIPTPHYALKFAGVTADISTSFMGHLALVALGIAAINSLRSLLVCTAGESLTQKRVSGNRELVGQGAGNMVSAIFGGISGAGSLSSTLANFRYGGRTGLSRAISGGFALLVLVLLHNLVAGIPKVVLAGMLIMIALKSFDSWSVLLVAKIKSSLEEHDRRQLFNIAIVVIVMTTLLTFGITEALGAGLVLSIGLLLRSMNKSVIRREMSGDQIHSNTLRPAVEFLLLEKEGDRIRILELEGALFFGTADKVASRTEEFFELDVEHVILDLQRLLEIDSTGANIIRQLLQKCAKKGLTLYLSWDESSGHQQSFDELTHMLTKEELQATRCNGIESALALAEDRLLEKLLNYGIYDNICTLRDQDALVALTDEEVETIREIFKKHSYEEEEAVFRQGDKGRSVYFIAAGRAHIVQILEGEQGTTSHRLATICPGMCFGEMAILDNRPRSTDVIADGDLVCYELTLVDIQEMMNTHPAIAFKILTGLGRDLATRVRVSNKLRGLLMR